MYRISYQEFIAPNWIIYWEDPMPLVQAQRFAALVNATRNQRLGAIWAGDKKISLNQLLSRHEGV